MDVRSAKRKKKSLRGLKAALLNPGDFLALILWHWGAVFNESCSYPAWRDWKPLVFGTYVRAAETLYPPSSSLRSPAFFYHKPRRGGFAVGARGVNDRLAGGRLLPRSLACAMCYCKTLIRQFDGGQSRCGLVGIFYAGLIYEREFGIS